VQSKLIFDNITERISNLDKKCAVNVKDLRDPELLHEKRDMKNLDTDFNDMLDRVTELGKHNPDEFDDTCEFLEIIADKKEDLKTKIDSFKTKVETEIRTRDLSEEKMKNASLLGIKLPKFKGYESSMDFYTFKTEFEKLIVPRCSAKLLPDYLKNNYLEGPALQLVKQIPDLVSIWERLKSSYGNVQSLLNKKLSELDKGVPLWKIRDEDKIIQAMLTLKNSMSELKTLATKHNIEHCLFHTSNLGRVFSYLGKKRQLDLTKKFIDADKSESEQWDEIIQFLDKEMKIREQVLLLSKSTGHEDGRCECC
jgi:hypothetical protein